MTIDMPEDMVRYIHAQVRAGLYRSEEEVILDALERHRSARRPSAHIAPTDPVLGSMREDADLLDEIVEHAMKNRREQPRRLPASE